MYVTCMRKIIKGFSKYTIDEHGTVTNISSGHVYTHGKCKAGYHRVYLYNDERKRKAVSVHRLVALHFVRGRTNLKNEVNHKDGDKSNNHHKNLEWCTRKYNMEHAVKVLGRKLGPQDKVIRNNMINTLHCEGYKVEHIALFFKISNPRVNQILSTFDNTPKNHS